MTCERRKHVVDKCWLGENVFLRGWYETIYSWVRDICLYALFFYRFEAHRYSAELRQSRGANSYDSSWGECSVAFRPVAWSVCVFSSLHTFICMFLYLCFSSIHAYSSDGVGEDRNLVHPASFSRVKCSSSLLVHLWCCICMVRCGCRVQFPQMRS